MDAATPRPTPMMEQYLAIKADYPDCLLFYRMGDFYELFFEDAEIASKTLGIVLTKRGRHEGDDIRMCGVPVERADEYLNKLIAAGHRVAIGEQMEDPAEAKRRGAKSVVKREVVRLVTPGTITEERLLEGGARQCAARRSAPALRRTARRATASPRSICRSVRSCSPKRRRRASPPRSRGWSLPRLSPRRRCCARARWRGSSRKAAIAATKIAEAAADPALAARRVAEFYGVASLDGFGAFTDSEIAAAALVFDYLKRTQFAATARYRAAKAPRARRASRNRRGDARQPRTDAHAWRANGVARCCTASTSLQTGAGARLLAERLASPLAKAGSDQCSP